MQNLKDFFTIKIDNMLFVPTIKDSGLTYSIEYKSNTFDVKSFCIIKKDRSDSSWKAIKRSIQDDLH